jgi:hypothetical protein
VTASGGAAGGGDIDVHQRPVHLTQRAGSCEERVEGQVHVCRRLDQECSFAAGGLVDVLLACGVMGPITSHLSIGQLEFSGNSHKPLVNHARLNAIACTLSQPLRSPHLTQTSPTPHLSPSHRTRATATSSASGRQTAIVLYCRSRAEQHSSTWGVEPPPEAPATPATPPAAHNSHTATAPRWS